MKRVISAISLVLLLLAMLAMPVSADDTAVRVYIDGPAQILSGDEVAVSLYVNGNTASGGVYGIFHYDPAVLTYEGVTLRDDVIALDNVDAETYRVDETAGTVKFVVVSNVTGGSAPADAWMTVRFSMNNTAAGQTATVTLSDVKVSNAAGDTPLTPTVIGSDKVTVVAAGNNMLVNMQGATIKTDITKQGIRFESVKTALSLSGLTEAGVVMLPTALMYEDQDLTKDTIGKGGVTPAVAKVTEADKLTAIMNGESLFATLTNGTTKGRANVSITARSYVVINGVTIYSHNDKVDTAITTGEANKTLAGVAQAIAKEEIAGGATETAEITAILAATKLTDDQVSVLLTFCRDNIACL